MIEHNTIREPLFHIIKRGSQGKWRPIMVRAIAIVAGLLTGLLFAWAYTKTNPFTLFVYMIEGVFGNEIRVWGALQEFALLLLISVAVVPAFKMKFWNIGADGQTLMGCLASAMVIYYFHDDLSNTVLLLLMFVSSVMFGVIWAILPAIFKAKWGTNETLFTLMMNYIATQIVSFVLLCWFPGGQNDFPKFYRRYGNFPKLYNNDLLIILFAVVFAVVMFFYLKNTKHGFEISLVGESENSARYVGINVKKVIIRTLIFSGAICGFVGFLLVSAKDHSITQTMVGGRGFTAIIVVWLAKFNPLYMALTSFMVVFLNKGTAQILSSTNITNGALPNIITALVFFFIIGCEFFIVYMLKFRKKNNGDTVDFITSNQISGKEKK